MPGRPKTKQDLVTLNDRSDEVFAMLADGMPQKEVRDRLGVGRNAWERWLGSERGTDVYARARAAAAHGLVEEMIAISDTVTPDNAEVAKARLRTDTRKWVASFWNRESYGDRGPAIAIQINGLHVGALRSRRVIEGEGGPEE